MNNYPYVWYWRKWPRDSWHNIACEESRYKGMFCKVLCRGRNGNILVEFADGYQVVTPRHAVRKRQMRLI